MLKHLMILLLIALAMVPAHAQEDSPAYALAFRVDSEVRIAAFHESSGWEVQTLPNFMLFGQYDVSLVLPTWIASGQLLGTGYAPAAGAEEPIEGGLASYLYRYDLPSETMEMMPQAIAEVENPDLYLPPTLAISSISPDGRYATLYNLIEMKGYLVDFERQQVLVTLDTCGLKGFHWTETSVFLGSYSAYIVCSPSFFEVDLTSGDTLTDMRKALELENLTIVDNGHWLGEDDVWDGNVLQPRAS